MGLHNKRTRKQQTDADTDKGNVEIDNQVVEGLDATDAIECCSEGQGTAGATDISWNGAVAAVKYNSKFSRGARRAKALKEKQEQQKLQLQHQLERQSRKDVSEAESSDTSTASGNTAEAHAK